MGWAGTRAVGGGWRARKGVRVFTCHCCCEDPDSAAMEGSPARSPCSCHLGHKPLSPSPGLCSLVPGGRGGLPREGSLMLEEPGRASGPDQAWRS